MEVIKSRTLVKLPSRTQSAVRSPKKRSTIFIHEPPVGVKWVLNLGCLASHALTSECLWVQ